MYIELLKEMFSEMVEKKNAVLVAKFYHEKFELYANGQIQDYAYFLHFHEKIYQTDIQYKVSYDESTLIETHEKVAARVFIDTTVPNEATKNLEVILIAAFKDHKIFRIWELCYPDWRQMKAFKQ
jgi:hypothetical protein